MRTKSTAPVGKLTGDFIRLWEAGCIQTGGEDRETWPTLRQAIHMFGARFDGLMVLTHDNPCDGCPEYKDGKCPAFQRYHTAAKTHSGVRKEQATVPPGTDKYPGLSVKQIAEKLGISKSEVRRRKLAGEL